MGGDSGADDAFNQLLSVISQLILIIFHNFICGLATFRAVCAIMCYISNGGIVFFFLKCHRDLFVTEHFSFPFRGVRFLFLLIVSLNELERASNTSNELEYIEQIHIEPFVQQFNNFDIDHTTCRTTSNNLSFITVCSLS